MLLEWRDLHPEHHPQDGSRWCRVEYFNGNFYMIILMVLVKYCFPIYVSDLKFFFK